jgi:competence protein ComEC
MSLREVTLAQDRPREVLAPEVAQMRITCCNIGQGDFTIIELPDDSVYIVDCGSLRWGTAQPEEVHSQLPKAPDGSFRPIQALVLTHPDADHYNKCKAIIGDISIKAIYHSNQAPLYKSWAFRRWYWGRGPGGANFGTLTPLTINAANKDPVKLGEGGKASVWAIASNVTAQDVAPTSAYAINTASIVIKCEFGNDSILIGADATCATEAFLVANAKQGTPTALRSNLLRVAHHGSQTSSSPDLIYLVKAPDAVISAAEGNGYELPRESVVERIELMVATDPQPAHRVCFYKSDKNVCVKAVEDAGPAGSSSGVEVVPPLTRATKRRLWVTGATGSITFSYDGK